MTGAETLRSIREAFGLSRSKLAERTDGRVSASAIREWEHGRVTPTVQNLRIVAYVFPEEDAARLLEAYGMADKAAEQNRLDRIRQLSAGLGADAMEDDPVKVLDQVIYLLAKLRDSFGSGALCF